VKTSLNSIGHSNQTLDSFMALLTRHGIETVVDVRSTPVSAYVPWFSREPLSASLRANRVSYLFEGDSLGARPMGTEHYVDGAVDYRTLAHRVEFRDGLLRTIDIARGSRTALLCTEGDPMLCHRGILIGPALRAMGVDYSHIGRSGDLETHEEMETRLLSKFKFRFVQSDLFFDRNDALRIAYEKQGRKLAHRGSGEVGQELVAEAGMEYDD